MLAHVKRILQWKHNAMQGQRVKIVFVGILYIYIFVLCSVPLQNGVTVPGAWFWPNGPAACLCRFRFPPRLPRRRLLSVMAGLKRGCIVKNLAQLRVDDPKIQLVVNDLFFKKTDHLMLILRSSCLQYDLQCLRLKKNPIHENEPCFCI